MGQKKEEMEERVCCHAEDRRNKEEIMIRIKKEGRREFVAKERVRCGCCSSSKRRGRAGGDIRRRSGKS